MDDQIYTLVLMKKGKKDFLGVWCTYHNCTLRKNDAMARKHKRAIILGGGEERGREAKSTD